MANYRLPDRSLPGFRALLEMSDETINRFEEVVRDLPQGLGPYDVSDHIALKGVLPEPAAKEVVRVLSDIYRLKDEGSADLDELVEGICDALKKLDEDSIEPSDRDWDKFKTRFKKLLSMDSTLGMSFKTFYLSIQNEKTYIESNIFSDIRPAFYSQVDDGFDTAAIIHNLQIEYHKDQTHEVIQIVLDGADVGKLKEQLDRAEKKEKAIIRQFKNKIAFLTIPKKVEKG